MVLRRSLATPLLWVLLFWCAPRAEAQEAAPREPPEQAPSQAAVEAPDLEEARAEERAEQEALEKKLAAQEVSCEGPLTSDAFRYPHMRVFPRMWRDLAAIPGSVVAWDEADWARFGAFALPTLTLMWPGNPSLDVRVQDWIKSKETPAGERWFLHIKTTPESIFLASYGAILFGSAWLSKNDRMFEFGTLSLEALFMTQFYHVVTKILIGRESPYQGNGQGDYYGPTKISFPGGTPSGHAATAFAVLWTAAEYWKKPVLYAFAALAGTYVSASLLYQRQHFVSDVIFGAGMGVYIAKWVVKHRSSRYRCRPKLTRLSLRERMMIVPVMANGGAMLTLGFRN